MAGVDPAPLPQEVADGRGATVVDDRLRLVYQPVPELADEAWMEISSTAVSSGMLGNDVAEGDDLAQLRRLAGDPVVQPPLQMNGVAEEGVSLLTGVGWPPTIPTAGIVEVAQRASNVPRPHRAHPR